MTLPNFIIIGAAKAGTTSLWHYLGQHPDVFISGVKEPNYFITLDHKAYRALERQKGGSQVVTSEWRSYESLFENAGRRHAVGEASPAYMFYEHTAQAIKSKLPNVKLICILRDPCERAFSHYNFLRLYQREPLRRFREAVDTDQQRPEAEKWHYIDQGLYFEQLSRYFELFSSDQIKVVFNQDLKANGTAVLAEIFDFLNVDASPDIDMSARLTVSGEPRSEFVHWFLAGANPMRRYLGPILPTRLRAMARRLKNANLRRQKLGAADRTWLMQFFHEDIRQLESLLQVDLPSWRSA